jgi:hypothetical protein
MMPRRPDGAERVAHAAARACNGELGHRTRHGELADRLHVLRLVVSPDVGHRVGEQW